LSLWLCCRAPIDPRDAVETLEFGAAEHGFGPYTLTPRGPVIHVEPWPFTTPSLDIIAAATWAEPGVYRSASEMLSKPTRTAWRLQRADSGP
ncbi:MAG: hypothetical protein AAGG46_10015, partial [Planctomycetota bacterium]